MKRVLYITQRIQMFIGMLVIIVFPIYLLLLFFMDIEKYVSARYPVMAGVAEAAVKFTNMRAWVSVKLAVTKKYKAVIVELYEDYNDMYQQQDPNQQLMRRAILKQWREYHSDMYDLEIRGQPTLPPPDHLQALESADRAQVRDHIAQHAHDIREGRVRSRSLTPLSPMPPLVEGPPLLPSSSSASYDDSSGGFSTARTIEAPPASSSSSDENGISVSGAYPIDSGGATHVGW